MTEGVAEELSVVAVVVESTTTEAEEAEATALLVEEAEEVRLREELWVSAGGEAAIN